MGSVLLIALDGGLRPSRVSGFSANKLLHTDVDGHERTIALKRVLWQSRQCCDSEASLAEYWREVRAEAGELDLASLWRQLESGGELDTYAPETLARRLYALDASPLREDALVVAVFEERLHFRYRKGKIHCASPEELHKAVAEKAAREKMARHQEIATRLLGQRLQDGAGTPADADEQEAIANHVEWLANLAVDAKDSAHYKVSLQLMRDLHLDVNVPTLAATELLVRLGEWLPHENVPLIRSRLKTLHDPAVVDNAHELAARAPELAGRKDYRSLLTVAIDDEATREVDDAFAMEGNRMRVFIADAAAWVPTDSTVFVEAADRVSTMYLPEGNYPMLPRILAEEQASLLEAQDRLALCFSFELEPDGELRHLEVERALVRVDKRLTYHEVDALLDPEPGHDLDPEVADLVYFAAEAMDAHAGFRERSGAMTFTRDEVNMTADRKTGDVRLEQTNPNGPARQLVAEMMVAVCGAAARLCVEHGIPTIFRSQPEPDEPIDKPEGVVTDPWEQWNILRRFKPSAITVYPAKHFSLALPAYTQVTSPLRRFQDLVMNHQLAAFARGHAPPFSEDDLVELIPTIERRTSEMRAVEQQSRRYWALWYLETHPDTVLKALVVHEVGRRWVVRIPELALIMTINPRRRLRRSQTIKLRVSEVNARRDRLVLTEA